MTTIPRVPMFPGIYFNPSAKDYAKRLLGVIDELGETKPVDTRKQKTEDAQE